MGCYGREGRTKNSKEILKKNVCLVLDDSPLCYGHAVCHLILERNPKIQLILIYVTILKALRHKRDGLTRICYMPSECVVNRFLL